MALKYFSDKKKKATNPTTWKKRLVLKRKRVSKSSDHSRLIRELVSTWSPQEIRTLHEEYESISALKDLTIQVRDLNQSLNILT